MSRATRSAARHRSPRGPPVPSPASPGLTCIPRVDMGRVEPELDEDGDGDAELEPLHHIGRRLPRERVDNVASQDHALASASGHKLGLLPRAEGTCKGRKAENAAVVGAEPAAHHWNPLGKPKLQPLGLPNPKNQKRTHLHAPILPKSHRSSVSRAKHPQLWHALGCGRPAEAIPGGPVSVLGCHREPQARNSSVTCDSGTPLPPPWLEQLNSLLSAFSQGSAPPWLHLPARLQPVIILLFSSAAKLGTILSTAFKKGDGEPGQGGARPQIAARLFPTASPPAERELTPLRGEQQQ